jgi:hypothetical protein
MWVWPGPQEVLVAAADYWGRWSLLVLLEVGYQAMYKLWEGCGWAEWLAVGLMCGSKEGCDDHCLVGTVVL